MLSFLCLVIETKRARKTPITRNHGDLQQRSGQRQISYSNYQSELRFRSCPGLYHRSPNNKLNKGRIATTKVDQFFKTTASYQDHVVEQKNFSRMHAKLLLFIYVMHLEKTAAGNKTAVRNGQNRFLSNNAVFNLKKKQEITNCS